MILSRKPRKAAEDYERTMLPQTRREVFLDILKLQWSKLLRLGLILLVSAIPLLMVAIYEDSYFLAVTENADVLREEVPALFSPFRIFCDLLRIPCIVVFFVGLSGVVRALRQLAWGENVTVLHDFTVGLRQNWKQFLAIGLVYGLCHALAMTGWHNSLTAGGGNVWIWGVILGLLLFLVMPVVCCAAVIVAIYNNSLTDDLRIAAFIYLKAPVKTVGAMLAAFAVCLIIWQIPSLWLHIILSIPAMAVFVLGFLGWLLFVCGQLDRYYNDEHYPELVGKGIGGR